MALVVYTCNSSIHDGFAANLGYIETLSLNTLQNSEKARTSLQENAVQAVNLSMWKEIIAKAAGREIEEREVQCFFCLHPFSVTQPHSGMSCSTWDRNVKLQSRFLLIIISPRKTVKTLCRYSYASPSDRIYFCVTPMQSSSVSMKPE